MTGIAARDCKYLIWMRHGRRVLHYVGVRAIIFWGPLYIDWVKCSAHVTSHTYLIQLLFAPLVRFFLLHVLPAMFKRS
jgi:hypothetical protein